MDQETFHIFHSSLIQRFVIGATVLYGLMLYWLGWRGLWSVPVIRFSHALGSLLGIMPFLVLLAGVWAACYPGRLRAGKTLFPYLWVHARLYLPVLIPWFTILCFTDLVGLVTPELEGKLQEDLFWGLGIFALLLLVLVWAFPRLVIALWKCPALPSGHLRRTMEDFFRAHGFRYSGIHLWTMLQGGVSTAGIMGVFPWARYILVTPSLIRTLNEQELLAVMAHEMGHVRYRHMVFYLAFMVGLTLLVDLCLRAVPWLVGLGVVLLESWGIPAANWLIDPAMDASSLGLFISILLLSSAVVYLRFGFGLFSRNFERQADLHAMELLGSSEPLIRSLEKIGGFHPLVRSLPSWHHYSIQERIGFLASCQRYPQKARSHQRKVRILVASYLCLLIALLGFLLAWPTMQWDKNWISFMRNYLVSKMMERESTDPSVWFLMGTLALERGDLARAEEALNRAIEKDPTNADALNNLAWLHATAQDPNFRDPQKALRLALEAARFKPNEPHILDTLAEAKFLNGQVVEALELEERALKLARDNTNHYRDQIKRFRRALSREP